MEMTSENFVMPSAALAIPLRGPGMFIKVVVWGSVALKGGL